MLPRLMILQRHPNLVKRGLDMVRVLFEQIIVTKGNSLKNPTSKAYAQTARDEED
ncbi:hypothetical protein LguiB_029715 [Lonicera macranthoides]